MQLAVLSVPVATIHTRESQSMVQESGEPRCNDGNAPPPVGGHALVTSLARQTDDAWRIAHYERERRQENITKTRFGLFGFNAASLLAISTIGKSMGDIAARDILITAAFFVSGVILAGISIFVQSIRQMKRESAAYVKAMAVASAHSASLVPASDQAQLRFMTALQAAHNAKGPDIADSTIAIFVEQFAAWVWVGGVLHLAFAAMASQGIAPKALLDWANVSTTESAPISPPIVTRKKDTSAPISPPPHNRN